ncbi:MAG TPA: acyl-CoA desaturase [Bacillales bacterium]|nr:acyl-CoA desaturase [Bacillales bacterium]
MKDLHSFGWYAGKIAPHLPKQAFRPVPGRLWGGLAYLLVTMSVMASIILFELGPWINLVLAIVLGFCFTGMGFLGHEILHGAVLRNRKWRDFLGAVAFFPLSTGPRLWRMWHNSNHHKHTQHEEHDPDSWPSMKIWVKSKFLRFVYKMPFPIRSFLSFCSLSVTFSMHSTRMFATYLRQFKAEDRKKVWLQFILPWTVWFALLFAIGFEKWFFAYFLPLLIANFIVMCYISTNHRLNPLVPVNDPLANSLSVTLPKWVDVLHFNFSYHTEHHLFPGMSAKYYPLVKQLIKQKWPDRYHEMPMGKALKALWRTPRVYFEGSELIDPHQGRLYGSLGHGLNPSNIRFRKRLKKERA